MGDRDLNKQTSLDYGHRTALITTATLPPRPRDQQLSKFHTFTNIFPAFITLFDDSNTAAMPSEYCPVYAVSFTPPRAACRRHLLAGDLTRRQRATAPALNNIANIP